MWRGVSYIGTRRVSRDASRKQRALEPRGGRGRHKNNVNLGRTIRKRDNTGHRVSNKARPAQIAMCLRKARNVAVINKRNGVTYAAATHVLLSCNIFSVIKFQPHNMRI